MLCSLTVFRLSADICRRFLKQSPVRSDNATATVAKGGFSFSWTTRFIDSMKVNDGSNDLTAQTAIYYKTDEIFYHDIVATYNWWKIQFIGGIDNLFDKTPLLVIDGTTNTDPNVYDVRDASSARKCRYKPVQKPV